MHQKGEGGAELWHCSAVQRPPVTSMFSTFLHHFSRPLCRASDRKVVGLMGRVAWLHPQSPRLGRSWKPSGYNLFLSVTPQHPESDNSSAYCLDFLSKLQWLLEAGEKLVLIECCSDRCWGDLCESLIRFGCICVLQQAVIPSAVLPISPADFAFNWR